MAHLIRSLPLPHRRGRPRPARAPRGPTPLAAGALALAIVAIGSWLVAARDIPFVNRPFELRAAFESAANVQARSPVRIAGVEVGEVKRVEALDGDAGATVVTMEVRRGALPIRADAEIKVRPRIFLEGNFFLDLRPGTPRAAELRSGATLPATQTYAPVQLDQVLTALQEDTRDNLQQLVQGYGDALAGEPLPGEDADQDRSVRGKTGAEALNASLERSPAALRGAALVNEALLGTEPHDLSRLVSGTGRVAAALASREQGLKDLVSGFDTTTAALAAEQRNLRATIRLLPQVLGEAGPALDALNDAFPPTRAFARQVLPGVRETPATIAAAEPWIAQMRGLLSAPELGGLAADLRPATADLASVTAGTVRLLPQADLASRCALDVVLPAGDVKIEDPPLSTGIENYKELFHSLVGLAGESQSFDGNGQYVRFQTGGGAHPVATGSVPSAGGKLFGNALRPPLGTRPARPARRPPFNRDRDCYRNPVPDLNSAKTGGGP